MILGIDPGFASIGVAVVESMNGMYVPSLDVIETQKSQDTPARYDIMRRGAEIYRKLDPLFSRRCFVTIEGMSYPRNSVVASKMALCYGVIASLIARHNARLIIYTPKQAKKVVCGDAGADKDQVRKAVEKSFGSLDSMWMRKIPRGKQNHAVDALAMVLAGAKENKWPPPKL